MVGGHLSNTWLCGVQDGIFYICLEGNPMQLSSVRTLFKPLLILSFLAHCELDLVERDIWVHCSHICVLIGIVL